MSKLNTSDPRDQLLVAVLKLLPVKRRECAFYAALCAGLLVVGAALYAAPSVTVGAGSGAGVLLWVRRLLGR